MISALFYLQFNSVKNRLTMRFKRLKQPKYLFGAIVGGLYMYWYFGRVLFGIGRRGQWGATTATSAPAPHGPVRTAHRPARSGTAISGSMPRHS